MKIASLEGFRRDLEVEIDNLEEKIKIDQFSCGLEDELMAQAHEEKDRRSILEREMLQRNLKKLAILKELLTKLNELMRDW